MEELDQKMIDEIVAECEVFFETDKITVPEVHFLYTREAMDEILGRKSERWERAVCGHGKISIFHPSKTVELTTHTNDDFREVIKHEMTHAFYNEITGSHQPRWFNEGLANVVAESPRQKPREIDEPVIDKYFAHSGPDTYAWGYWMVKYLLGEFSKDKLVQLIKSLAGGKMTKEFFAEKFRAVYSFDVSELQAMTSEKLKKKIIDR